MSALEDPISDPMLDKARLQDPIYFEQMTQKYRADPRTWMWYVNYHLHGCKQCNRVWAHTGLEAVRDGLSSHLCCGKDVRVTS